MRPAGAGVGSSRPLSQSLKVGYNFREALLGKICKAKQASRRITPRPVVSVPQRQWLSLLAPSWCHEMKSHQKKIPDPARQLFPTKNQQGHVSARLTFCRWMHSVVLCPGTVCALSAGRAITSVCFNKMDARVPVPFYKGMPGPRAAGQQSRTRLQAPRRDKSPGDSLRDRGGLPHLSHYLESRHVHFSLLDLSFVQA